MTNKKSLQELKEMFLTAKEEKLLEESYLEEKNKNLISSKKLKKVLKLSN